DQSNLSALGEGFAAQRYYTCLRLGSSAVSSAIAIPRFRRDIGETNRRPKAVSAPSPAVCRNTRAATDTRHCSRVFLRQREGANQTGRVDTAHPRRVTTDSSETD